MTTATIHHGDCLAVMAGMEASSVHCCVTSPPYYGLRDYGHEGQIGLEESPQAYVEKMVEVFREARRVLRDDGTVWLNLGDSYNSAASGQNGQSGTLGGGAPCGGNGTTSGRRPLIESLKPKDLIGIPWRVAFALQADGWYLRQDIIWAKPNPMPESVRDRCTKSHEYIFLLSKSPRYYYDAAAIAEPVAPSQEGRIREDVVGGSSHVERGQHSKGGTYRGSSFNKGNTGVNGNGRTQPDEDRADPIGQSDTRNKRSVWTVTTQPFPEAHFATFPVALIEPCILAGCPEGGTVLDPFGGAGTTAVAAIKHDRNSVLCELNAEYVEIARRRINGVLGMFGECEVVK